MTVEQRSPGALRYHAVRLVLKAVTAAYVRTSVVDADRIPASGSYVLCFNHPSWLDPIFLAAYWPDRARTLYILGPREEDMSRGLRNRLITWTRRGVPFKPEARDVVDTTRRALAVLRSNACLAIAGEGRLSDHEGRILPLQSGLAHFATLSGASILPVAIVGTRWVSLGSRVSLRVGRPVHPRDFARGRPGARAMTEAVEVELSGLLAGVDDREPPGWLGRTISEAFNDRPWLDEGPDEGPGAAPDEGKAPDDSHNEAPNKGRAPDEGMAPDEATPGR